MKQRFRILYSRTFYGMCWTFTALNEEALMELWTRFPRLKENKVLNLGDRAGIVRNDCIVIPEGSMRGRDWRKVSISEKLNYTNRWTDEQGQKA